MISHISLYYQNYYISNDNFSFLKKWIPLRPINTESWKGSVVYSRHCGIESFPFEWDIADLRCQMCRKLHELWWFQHHVARLGALGDVIVRILYSSSCFSFFHYMDHMNFLSSFKRILFKWYAFRINMTSSRRWIPKEIIFLMNVVRVK